MWCRERLNEWFVHADVLDILNIPLRLTLDKDRLYWFHDSKGFYSVRSGHRLAVHLKREKKLGTAADLGWWNIIWRLDMPCKIKHFLWKGCRNYFTWCLNLDRRGI